MMRSFLVLLLTFQAVTAQVIQRAPVPALVVQEAQQAVQQLATEMMKENYLYAFQHMYPRLKESSAKEIGGMAALEKRFAEVPAQMRAQGINIIDFRVENAVNAFEVKAALFDDLRKAPEFTEYLVILPTTTLYRGVDSNTGTVKRLQRHSYQLAIRGKKPGSSWTFIDGGSMTIRQLRSLFPNLPQNEADLRLPAQRMQEL